MNMENRDLGDDYLDGTTDVAEAARSARAQYPATDGDWGV